VRYAHVWALATMLLAPVLVFAGVRLTLRSLDDGELEP
jgi:hypothetical protein